MTLEELIKKYKLSEYHTPESIKDDIELAKLNNLDPALVVILTHFDLFNFHLFERMEWVKLNQKVLDIIDKNGLKKIRTELVFIAHVIAVICLGGKGMDNRLPHLVPYYKEIDNLIHILKERRKEVNEISIKTNKATYKFRDSVIIERMLNQIELFYLSKKVVVKYYDIDYKFKGRPKSYRTQSLKKSCNLICEYLDYSNKLMPGKGRKISDKRRKFLADFLLSIEAISINDFESNPKDYINSLLT